MEGKPNYQSAMRKEKIDTIELVIDKCSQKGVPALKSELYSFALQRWGSEWRKFTEYLSDLVMLKVIVVDGNDCWTMKRWRKIEDSRKKSYMGAKQFISIAEELRLKKEANE